MLNPKQLIKTYQNRWAGIACFLEGKPAKVCGRLNNFATIAQLTDGLSVEYSWPTVDRIMGKSKQFSL